MGKAKFFYRIMDCAAYSFFTIMALLAVVTREKHVNWEIVKHWNWQKARDIAVDLIVALKLIMNRNKQNIVE